MSQEIQNLIECLALRRARLCNELAKARCQNKPKSYIESLKLDRRYTDQLYSQAEKALKIDSDITRSEEMMKLSVLFKKALISDTYVDAI